MRLFPQMGVCGPHIFQGKAYLFSANGTHSLCFEFRSEAEEAPRFTSFCFAQKNDPD